MSLRKMILENEIKVVSKDVDEYLQSLGFKFRFIDEYGVCEYYVIVQIGGHNYKISFMSETELYIELLGVNSSGRINVWHLIFELFKSRDILNGTKSLPMMTSSFLKSEEFNRAFNYMFKYKISK